MKHTPGPWTTKKGYHAVTRTMVDGRQGRLAASIFHPSQPHWPMIRVSDPTGEDAEAVAANAKLIAAAPDMLNALQEIQQILGQASLNDCETQAWNALQVAKRAMAWAKLPNPPCDT